MRRCLGCNVLIERGSRCSLCRKKYRTSYSRTEWALRIKDRDGWQCVVCGSRARLEADHMIALADGGGDALDNGITLCHTCHLRKHHDKPMEIA